MRSRYLVLPILASLVGCPATPPVGALDAEAWTSGAAASEVPRVMPALAFPSPLGPNGLPSPVVDPPGIVTIKGLAYQDWGTIIADAACAGSTLHFEGTELTGVHHVAIWLQGIAQGFMPADVENGRVPGAVLLGESDVVDGGFDFKRTFAPEIGPTEDGGMMPLVARDGYGWVMVDDGKMSVYQAVTLPARPCLPAETPPRLSVQPQVVCAATNVALAGDGFAPGPVVIQLWKSNEPNVGGFDTGKAPPDESELGRTQADASGHFTFTWSSAVEGGGRYSVRVLDRGRTRVTTLDLQVCSP